MLTVLSARVPIGQLAYYAAGTSSRGVRAYPDVNVSRVASTTRHEFLHQGRYFDSFGDSVVHNFQLNGVISRQPIVNGKPTTVTRWSVKQSTTTTGYATCGPCIDGSGTPCLEHGPAYLAEAAYSRTTGYTITLLVYKAIRMYGAEVIIGATVTARNMPSGAFVGASAQSFVGGRRSYWSPAQELFGIEDHYGGIKNINDALAVGEPLLRPHLDAALARATHQAYQFLSQDPSWVGQPYSVRIRSYTEPDTDAIAILNGIADDLYEARRVTFVTPSVSSIKAREVIESLANADNNLIAYASDLRKTGDTIREVLKFSKNLRSPKQWASLWLSGRYGDRLFVSDTVDLVRSLQRRLKRQYPALGRSNWSDTRTMAFLGRDVVVSESLTWTVIAANESYTALMTAVNNLMNWDAWPTLENVWDMVPLSFVVDWVLPVQDLLGQIDAAVEAPYIKPLSQYRGRKVTVQYRLTSDTGLSGTIVASYYERDLHNVLGNVRPFDVIAEPPSFSVVKTVDALALVLTARKHR